MCLFAACSLPVRSCSLPVRCCSLPAAFLAEGVGLPSAPNSGACAVVSIYQFNSFESSPPFDQSPVPSPFSPFNPPLFCSLSGSLARRVMKDLASKGLIVPVSNSSKMPIYTKKAAPVVEETADETAE